MKPSDILLSSFALPLVGTMGRAEVELAAAIIVRVLVLRGDTWRAVTLQECKDVETEEREKLAGKREGEAAGFWQIPPMLCRPDFPEMVVRGFARFAQGELDAGGAMPIEFTEKGLEALKRWARPSTDPRPAA